MTATRRTFLQSSLIALSLPLSAPIHAGSIGTAGRLRIVTETACTETQRLIATCGIDSEAIDSDPSRFLLSLQDDLRADRVDVVFGLTFDSNRFLAAQIAYAYAFTRDYFGVHDFRQGHSSHVLDGHAGFVNAIGDAIDADPESWIEAIAASLSLLSSPDGAATQRSMDVSPTRSRASAPYLVSWSLRRG